MYSIGKTCLANYPPHMLGASNSESADTTACSIAVAEVGDSISEAFLEVTELGFPESVACGKAYRPHVSIIPLRTFPKVSSRLPSTTTFHDDNTQQRFSSLLSSLLAITLLPGHAVHLAMNLSQLSHAPVLGRFLGQEAFQTVVMRP